MPADILTQNQEQEDALYVLGVAGLASKRLLQKYRKPVEGPPQTLKAAVDMRPKMAVLDVPNEEGPIDSLIPVTKSAVSQALTRLSQSRKSLHKYQSDQLRSAASFCARGPAKLCRAVWQMGGGKVNVVRTLGIAVAVMLLLVRPLVHFVASEGVNMTRGA